MATKLADVQTFDYDRFGNVYIKSANNATTGQSNPLPYTAIEDSDISKSTNRFASNTTYDDASNVTTDNSSEQWVSSMMRMDECGEKWGQACDIAILG